MDINKYITGNQSLIQISIVIFNSFMTEVPIIIETSPFICSANQWTDFYMVGTSVIKELNLTKCIVKMCEFDVVWQNAELLFHLVLKHKIYHTCSKHGTEYQ